MLYRISRPDSDSGMVINVRNSEDIVPVLALQNPGRFHVDVLVDFEEQVASGRAARTYATGNKLPDGQVEMRLETRPRPRN